MESRPYLRYVRGFFRYLNATLLIGCFAGAGFAVGAWEHLNRIMPSAEDLSAYRPRLTTEIYSTEVQKDGRETHTLLARVFSEDREPVDLAGISPDLVSATIAIEDRRFREHSGLSPKDIARAALIDVKHYLKLSQGEPFQGASTITQQLVRNVWLSREKTFDRKIKEAMLALEVERKYSKDEILEMYLNQVYYGHGACGIKTAARLYYGKTPDKLKLHEAALLAGVPQSPNRYSPYRSPDRCKGRRDAVLGWMRRLNWIGQSEYQEAVDTPIKQGLQPLRERGVVARQAPYFTNLVIHDLCNQYGSETVYQGGLRVYTTLDTRVQKIAEEALTERVEELRDNGSIKRGLVGQGGMACVEVQTGRVLAMVGGVGPYEKVQYNRAHPGPPNYGRQPGSSFKPYIWAAALENGYGPNSVFSADPISIRLGPGRYWTPKNYTTQSGNYTLRSALAASVNLVSVRLVQKLTPSKVQRLAAATLEVPPDRIRPVMAMALGASEVSPLEQASGYCAFANGGFRPSRQLIRRIENQDGQVLQSFTPHMVRVMRPETANSMLSMLQTVIRSGTGRPARACGLPCGGKTGTTNSSRDVWFVGVTPNLSAAVWIGNDDNAPMPRGSGSGFCAPAWAKFMREATEVLGCDGEFPEGAGIENEKEGEPEEKSEDGRMVTVCAETGLLATPDCPVTKQIRLERGEEAPGPCTIHGHGDEAAGPRRESGGGGGAVRVCAESGELATPFCPSTVVRRVAPGEGPGSYCSIHGPAVFSPRQRSEEEADSAPERPSGGTDGTGRRRPPQPGATGGATTGPPAGQLEGGGGPPPDGSGGGGEKGESPGSHILFGGEGRPAGDIGKAGDAELPE